MHFFSFVGVLLICRVSLAGLVLDVSYSGNPAYESAFTRAKATWESLLSGYQDGLITDATINSSYVAGQTISSVFVSASVAPIDNAGSILAQAGPTELALDASGFFLATDGSLTIDSFDVAAMHAAGTLESVVAHEIGHILGFGSLWNLNNVYVSGSGEFTGANATAAWQSEFGQLGTPDVELEGGPGTANGHWNEVLNGAALTGITDSLGRDMRDELMTGWANPNSFISEMTVASFVDIGFTATPVPEPSSLLALSAIALFTAARLKRASHNRSGSEKVARFAWPGATEAPASNHRVYSVASHHAKAVTAGRHAM